jgi:hypothetical protein
MFHVAYEDHPLYVESLLMRGIVTRSTNDARGLREKIEIFCRSCYRNRAQPGGSFPAGWSYWDFTSYPQGTRPVGCPLVIHNGVIHRLSTTKVIHISSTYPQSTSYPQLAHRPSTTHPQMLIVNIVDSMQC